MILLGFIAYLAFWEIPRIRVTQKMNIILPMIWLLIGAAIAWFCFSIGFPVLAWINIGIAPFGAYWIYQIKRRQPYTFYTGHIMIAQGTWAEMERDFLDLHESGTLEDAAMNYRQLIRDAPPNTSFVKVNHAIKRAWGAPGLQFVKRRAWGED